MKKMRLILSDPVAPLAGARIEISKVIHTKIKVIHVAPLAGARIEILQTSNIHLA